MASTTHSVTMATRRKTRSLGCVILNMPLGLCANAAEPASVFELIANAPDRLDIAGPFRILLDLLSEAAHMHRHRATVARVGPVPYLVEQVLPREDLTMVPGEEFEQIELAGGQFDFVFADLDLPAIRP